LGFFGEPLLKSLIFSWGVASVLGPQKTGFPLWYLQPGSQRRGGGGGTLIRQFRRTSTFKRQSFLEPSERDLLFFVIQVSMIVLLAPRENWIPLGGIWGWPLWGASKAHYRENIDSAYVIEVIAVSGLQTPLSFYSLCSRWR